MKLLIKDNDLDFLSDQYETIKFHMLRSDDHLSFISCLACVCKTSSEIVENWRSIQNMVTVYHQKSGRFDSWNMYLAFASVESIPEWRKYEIENNKFSARKIVLDGLHESPNIDQLIIALENQLFGSDLSLESRTSQLKDNSPSLEHYYRDAPLGSKNKSREQRALMIDKIIKSLNNNEN